MRSTISQHGRPDPVSKMDDRLTALVRLLAREAARAAFEQDLPVPTTPKGISNDNQT